MNYLAVYGTLKHGNHNDHFMLNSNFVGSGETVERFPMVNNSNKTFPYLYEVPGKGFNVVVEVYKVDDDTLRQLDIHEGVSIPERAYYRAMTNIKLNHSGKIIPCNIYFAKDRDGYRDKKLLRNWYTICLTSTWE